MIKNVRIKRFLLAAGEVSTAGPFALDGTLRRSVCHSVFFGSVCSQLCTAKLILILTQFVVATRRLSFFR